MPNRKELKEISITRFNEVKVLYENKLYDGAQYLSGYVVETALKARICKILDSDYPDSGEISKSFLTHKIDSLIKLSGLEKALKDERAINVNFDANWSLVTNWKETFRYKPIGASTQADVSDIINALDDKNDGVLTWIKKRW